MYKFEFSPDDLFINRLKTNPQYNVFIHQGQMFVNKESRLTGSGGLVIYDINRNLTGSNMVTPNVIVADQNSGFKPLFKKQIYQPLVKHHSGDFQWTGKYHAQANDPNIIASYNALGIPGSVNSSTYGIESPITRKLTEAQTTMNVSHYHLGLGQNTTSVVGLGNTSQFLNFTASALQNVARKYTTLSDHFIFESSSVRSRNLNRSTVNFIFIPNMYYGSSIKKGSVELNYYITGSKIASCADKTHNGTLIGTTGSTSGSVVGLVLYDEGVIMLTSSVNLEIGPALNIKYNGNSAAAARSSWKYYGTTLNDSIDPASTNLAKSSFDLNFKGTNFVNTMTMFAHAKKGDLNHSNNPTYRDLEFERNQITGSGITFAEGTSQIANIVSASYTSASFDKTTYISKINIYDEDNNLIAVTTLANPVKKTLEDEFTFKMKLDL